MRARWIALGVVLLVVLGLVALFVFNADLTSVTMEEGGGRRTWTIQSGDTEALSVDEVDPDDRYRCELDGGSYVINGTPSPGERAVAGSFTVATAEDGTVTLICEPHLPADV